MYLFVKIRDIAQMFTRRIPKVYLASTGVYVEFGFIGSVEIRLPKSVCVLVKDVSEKFGSSRLI